MPKCCMTTFDNGRNNSKTACICLCRVRFPPTWGGGGGGGGARVSLQSVPTWWLRGAGVFMLSMLSGEIYLRLKPYLVVKMFLDIVTEHCCQVCVLSMIFCRSDCRLCADMVSDCTIRNSSDKSTTWFDLTWWLFTAIGQRGYKLFFTFDFHISP